MTSTLHMDRGWQMLKLGMLGDCLGAKVEFMKGDVLANFTGNSGLIEKMHHAYGCQAAITDDTQMTMFTLEGMLFWDRAGLENLETEIKKSYLRWWQAQEDRLWSANQGYMHMGAWHMDDNINFDQPERNYAKKRGWLIRESVMRSSRSPGGTCLTGLANLSGQPAILMRPSKGSGGVMRVAPIAFIDSYDDALRMARMSAEITHTHTDGWLPAQLQVAVLHRLLHQNIGLGQAVDEVIVEFREHKSERSYLLLRQARILSRHKGCKNVILKKMLQSVGEGWTGDEAFGVAIFCALAGNNAIHAISLAVSHDGDSDTTGAICGNIVGAMYDPEDVKLPTDWKLHESDEALVRKLYMAWHNRETPPDGEQIAIKQTKTQPHQLEDFYGEADEENPNWEYYYSRVNGEI